MRLTLLVTIDSVKPLRLLDILIHSLNLQTSQDFDVVFFNQTRCPESRLRGELRCAPRFSHSYWTLPRSDFLGEHPLWDLYAFHTAMLDEGRILMWPAAAFRDQVRSNVTLAYGAMLQLCGYWRMLISQLKDLKLLSATERLATLLLSLAPPGAGAVRARLPGNRSLVAGLLGVAPQSLSRAFAGLRPIGVSGGGREVTIADIGRLREFTAASGPTETKVQTPERTPRATKRASRPLIRKAA